jgi:membrane-associated phospholipid phosphatase
MEILDNIGMYGVIGVNIYGIIKLWENHTSLSIFVLFIIANEILNRLLKTTIRQERPSELISDKMDSAYYGMPSGHAQHIFFSAMYLQLVKVEYMELIWAIALITMYERVANEKHSFIQVVVGAIIGLGVGYFAHQLTYRYISF